MTVDNGDDLKHLKSIGRIVFGTMLLMKNSLKPGISTAALDRIGEKISLDMALDRRPF